MPLIPIFAPWNLANPTLPKMYWGVKSQEQLIAQLYCIIDYLRDYENQQTDEINASSEAISELEELFKKFQESGFEDYYEAQLQEWIENHPAEIWAALGKMVFFGLTSDGHFCAYVPESWSDIVFDTGAVYGTEQYGRLILRYETDGQGVIDNTSPYYPGESMQELSKKVDELRHTVYTALTSTERK